MKAPKKPKKRRQRKSPRRRQRRFQSFPIIDPNEEFLWMAAARLLQVFLGDKLGDFKPPRSSPEECPCKCHLVPIYGGVSCPLGCPTSAHFDGCHVCDCPSGELYTKHAADRKRRGETEK